MNRKTACKSKKDCFAYRNGMCTRLTSLACADGECRFYKSKEQYESDRLEAERAYLARSGKSADQWAKEKAAQEKEKLAQEKEKLAQERKKPAAKPTFETLRKDRDPALIIAEYIYRYMKGCQTWNNSKPSVTVSASRGL